MCAAAECSAKYTTTEPISQAQGAVGIGSVTEKINCTMKEEYLLSAALLLSSFQALFLLFLTRVVAEI